MPRLPPEAIRPRDMVYVDDMTARYRGMIMCHMIADSRAELLSMAGKLGLKPKWLQRAGTGYEHFDVCKNKRAKAVTLGAKEVTSRELVEIINKKYGT